MTVDRGAWVIVDETHRMSTARLRCWYQRLVQRRPPPADSGCDLRRRYGMCPHCEDQEARAAGVHLEA